MLKQSCTTAFAITLLTVVGGLQGCKSENMYSSGLDASSKRPNIVLIVADDLGYSDISPYGAEINTPNLASLAEGGIKLTQFYAAPTCSPTRAMLMSGVDSHLAGLGTMAERMTAELAGKPGYEGYLNHRVAALPEVLKTAGYHTYMAGKWHLGKDEHTNPEARGFEHSFALLDGAGFHLNNWSHQDPDKGHPRFADYAEDGEPVNLPADFYSTRTYTEKLIEYIDAGRDDDRPFFAYLALTAPHWPLQAPAESRDKYAGFYDEGYDVWYERRLQGMQDAGVAPTNMSAFPRFPGERPWDQLSEEEKQYSARKMEIQSAMIDDIDHYIGRLIEYLKETNQYDNTLIVFLSDNGVDGRHIDQRISSIGDWPSICCDNSLENIGADNSFVWLGPNWGRVSSGPLRLWKSSIAEGGIRVPAIFSYPALVDGNRIAHAQATVKDIMPTFLDVTGIELNAENFEGRTVLPVQGKSIWPLLRGQAENVHDPEAVFGWELSGKKALRQGKWKLLWDSEPFGLNRWALYNLDRDPSEMHDISDEYPEQFEIMKSLWTEYKNENNVIEFPE